MKCKHNNLEVMNNGGIYCKDCLETNIYHKVVKDNKGTILFKGNIWECEQYLDTLLPKPSLYNIIKKVKKIFKKKIK